MTAIALIRLVKTLFEKSPYVAVENVKGLFEQVMQYPIMMYYDNSLKLLLLQDPAILAPEEIVSNKALTLSQSKREG